MNDRQRLEAIVAVVCRYLPPDGISREEAMSQIISLVDPLPEQEQWDTSDMAHRSGGLSVEQAEKQERVPESWMGITDNPYCDDANCNDPNGRAMRWHKKLLYIYKQEHAAPKREWVGLNDKDFKYQQPAEIITMKYTEAILKEKNT